MDQVSRLAVPGRGFDQMGVASLSISK
jgi:hypothetical protein